MSIDAATCSPMHVSLRPLQRLLLLKPNLPKSPTDAQLLKQIILLDLFFFFCIFVHLVVFNGLRYLEMLGIAQHRHKEPSAEC